MKKLKAKMVVLEQDLKDMRKAQKTESKQAKQHLKLMKMDIELLRTAHQSLEPPKIAISQPSPMVFGSSNLCL